jgi:pyrroline-5-carboxylate reductase
MNNTRIGIIGYGSMGSMLFDGFYESKIINPSDLYLSNRTKEKISHLTSKGINICESNSELVSKSDIIFICIRPYEFKELFNEIKSELKSEKHIISIAGSLTMKNIETIHNGKISRIIPTFISTIKQGITLVCHNIHVLDNDKALLFKLLSHISTVKNIPEEEFELISIITSCAPGLIAEIFKEYVHAASKHTNLDRKQLSCFAIETLFGTAKLLIDNLDFDNIIDRVATKGGTTEVGVEVLNRNLPSVFDEMFQKALERQNIRKKKLDEQFIL